MPLAVPKITRLREMARAHDHDIVIEVDGGVTAETAPQVVAAGARALVAGAAVFGARKKLSGDGGFAARVDAYRAAIDAIRVAGAA